MKEEKIVFGNVAISCSKLFLGSIPGIGPIFSELFSFAQSVQVQRRLDFLQDEMEKLKIDRETFVSNVELGCKDDHKYCAFRNSMKCFVVEAYPEVVDIACKNFIDIVMTKESSLEEHLCEIIRQLNADDIRLLILLKQYSTNNHFTLKMSWGELVQFAGLSNDKYSVGEMLNIQYYDVTDADLSNPLYSFTFMARSVLKLQQLGILLGYSNGMRFGGYSADYDILEVTIFGQKLLKYF